MENTNLQSILDKAQKLQSLAERAGTAEEAAVAASKLQDLMLRYNVTQAQVEGHVTEDEMDKQYYNFEEKRNYRAFASTLYYNLADLNLCQAIYNPKTGSSTIIGKKHNIQIVHYLYAYLSREIKRLADKAARYQPNPGVYRRTFCIGAMNVVLRRLREAKKTVQQETEQTNAIVLAEEGLVKAAFDIAFPRTSKASGPSISDGGAYKAGREAGERIPLNQGVAGRGSVGQLA